MSSASWCRVRGFVLPAQSKKNRTLRLLFEELCWNICRALLQNNTSRMEKHDVFLHHIKTRWTQACTYYGWKILSFNNASILHIYCELLIMSYQCNWFTVYHICVSKVNKCLSYFMFFILVHLTPPFLLRYRHLSHLNTWNNVTNVINNLQYSYYPCKCISYR